jgi:hypothetical protein
MRISGALAVLLLAGAPFAWAAPVIRWVPSAGRVSVEVSGLDDSVLAAVRDWPAEKWSSLLAVRVQQQGAPAMLGDWKADADALRFVPQFPLTPGVAYRAEFDAARLPGAAAGAQPITSEFTMPAPSRGPATLVSRVFPNAAELPENLLKFYLHFSAPMSRGHIYDHIHLIDETGKDVELPFLDIDEELWDPEMKRLTLFIDPGRIKRGVLPLEEIGPSLQQGKRFTLAIDPAWLDATGRPLARKFEYAFRVGPPDRKAIEPSEWKLAPPSAGQLEPLKVTFPKPMDHALALRLLRVMREDGKFIEGTSSLADSDRLWTFTPARPWQAGPYRLVVPAVLEDLAGNNVGKAFEVENQGEPLSLGEGESLPFEVK